MSVAYELHSAEAVAALDGVSVRRGDTVVLHPLDWAVHAGERWVVLGANGAGKSTLLGALAGAERPSSGRVRLLGECLADADLDELLPRVGWASATLADLLPADELVIDVVLTASQASVRRGAEDYSAGDVARACDLLTWVGARLLLERRFGTLSEGERKRVQLARALMTDPELLLLDEPAAGLDLGGREALLRMLSRLAGDPAGPVQVLVSHHVEEIPSGTTHALLLREGRVVAAGPIEAALTSATLSAAFGLPLRVLSSDGRWTARAAMPR
ncbi:MAG TPA: ATP-binding cassette domain-containing protein [Mycobacteriales bacterium]|nr:ATP-binding cassette domain-containing protein [Mycobacteriales bacterium]HWA65471.1 ATP-binding cassette domain-containing protein [Mycobacteriales bacterium]